MTTAEAVLRRVVAAEGPEVLVDAGRLEALLMDYSEGVDPRRGTRLLVQAVRVGSVAGLLWAFDDEKRARETQFLVERMRSAYGTDRDLATWAVAVWAPVVAETREDRRCVRLGSGLFLPRNLGDGTVIDARTGLQWMQCSLGQSWAYGKCEGEAKAYSRKATREVMKVFERKKMRFAGHRDWRLPYTHELS